MVLQRDIVGATLRARGDGVGHGDGARCGLRRRLGFAAVVGLAVLTLGACATGRSVAVSGEQCLPPGVPPLAQWMPLQAKPAIQVSTQGRPLHVAIMGYVIDGKPAGAIWYQGRVVAIDPNTQNPQTPVWLDRGAVNPAGVLTGGEPTCDWVTAVPPGVTKDGA